VDTLTNELPLPIEKIEEALITFARPGMYGSVRIRLRLLPTAVFEIQQFTEYREITRPDVAKDEGPIKPSNERVNKVRNALQAKRHKFRLLAPVTELVGNFHDGSLSSLEVVEVEN